MLQHDRTVYASAPLRRLLDDQACVMVPQLQRCFGAHGLHLSASQFDVPPPLPLLSCWTHAWVDGDLYRGDFIGSSNEPLPFADDGFDLVLLRHALEVVAAAPELLAETVRVLAPGGTLVVTGVHPFSGWAPWFYWYSRGCAHALQMPWQLVQGLHDAGVERESLQRVGGMLPGAVGKPSGWGRTLGGGYVLVARKLRRGVTPLRLRPIAVTVAGRGEFSPGTRRSAQ